MAQACGEHSAARYGGRWRQTAERSSILAYLKVSIVLVVRDPEKFGPRSRQGLRCRFVRPDDERADTGSEIVFDTDLPRVRSSVTRPDAG